MTKGQYIIRVRKALEEIERSPVSPLEASDILMRVARIVADDHKRYGLKSKWEECPNTVFHYRVEQGIEDSHAQCSYCKSKEIS